jgi:antitoxin VapB
MNLPARELFTPLHHGCRGRLRNRSAADRRARVLKFLEKKIWPTLPKSQLGRRLTRAEEDDILGYGPEGV